MKADEVFALENAGWPALLVNNAGTIQRANQAAVKQFGPALAGGTSLSSIWSSENGSTAEQFIAQWERSPSTTVTLKFRVKGASHSFLVSLCAFTRDGQKFFVFQLLPDSGAELSLAQKQKLDCALQLARTVSLDFNNALTSILGHTSLLLSQMEVNHPWRTSLMEVEKSAAKAAEIASDLGAFSRQEKEPRAQSAGNLNSIVQRSIEIFQGTPGAAVQWNPLLGRQLFAARFDEAKIQQVFVKILENAVQSIQSSGKITVQTRNVELSEASQDRELRLAPGTYVCVEISDTGCGIAPDVLPRIFEPFFTTKKSEAHRGLGLALVYGIVTNHGGGVAVSSQPGVGTSVRVYLPAEKKIVHDATTTSDDLNGSQTILMVDDEDLLLTMGQTVLSAYGYEVITANSGQKALEIMSKPDIKIDLVITDMVMPAMSGRELMEHIHLISPQTRILCTSGFVRPNQEDDSPYLQKPFTSQNLLLKVKSTLAAK
jgi:signal transduction histidine kinase